MNPKFWPVGRLILMLPILLLLSKKEDSVLAGTRLWVGIGLIGSSDRKPNRLQKKIDLRYGKNTEFVLFSVGFVGKLGAGESVLVLPH